MFTASAIRHPFFRPPFNVQRSTRNQYTHTPLTTSTLDPIHSSKLDTHLHVPNLPLRLPLFMCNTVPYPHPFYLPPLLYSILSHLFSLFIYYVHIVYVLSPWVLHACCTLCIYARSTSCISQPGSCRVYQWYMRLYLKFIIFSQWLSGRLYKSVLNLFQHLQCYFPITHFQRPPRVRE